MGRVIYLLVSILILGVAYNINEKLIKPTPAPKLQPKWWGPGKEPLKIDTSIRSFKINVSDEVLEDLQYRLDHARLPSPPLEGVGFQYGFNSNELKQILKFWRAEYKWRESETFLNQYPQFKTKIQGLDIHFIHIKPKTTGNIKVMPIMLLHGWPGSVREFYQLIPLLTRKQEATTAGFTFELIVPSLPGYGWSDGAAKPGLGPIQMSVIFKQLMERLGFKAWYVQGGDWGSQIASHMGALYPENVLGLHLNLCMSNSLKTNVITFGASIYPSLFMEKIFEEKMYPYWTKFSDKLLETGYFHIQATKPDTVGSGLADSPIGMAAYMLEKFSTGTNKTYRNMEDGGLTQKFSYTELLDNVMIYWVTNTMTTAMRIYAESYVKENRDLNMDNVQVLVPTWCARFPTEIAYQPDWMLRHRYPNLKDSTDMPIGGHFAAMEVPQLLASDIWAAVILFQKER